MGQCESCKRLGACQDCDSKLAVTSIGLSGNLIMIERAVPNNDKSWRSVLSMKGAAQE